MSTPGIVTTESHGAYYGSYTTDAQSPQKLELQNARVIAQWPTGGLGFLVLAEVGPGEWATVSTSVANLTIFNITSIAECTVEAAAAYDALP